MLSSEVAVYDVFISYSRSDREDVVSVADALTAAGLAVWLDERYVDHFDEIGRRVDDALADSKVVLAWLTPTYARRPACLWEMATAIMAARVAHEPIIHRVLPVAADPAMVRWAPQPCARSSSTSDPATTLRSQSS